MCNIINNKVLIWMEMWIFNEFILKVTYEYRSVAKQSRTLLISKQMLIKWDFLSTVASTVLIITGKVNSLSNFEIILISTDFVDKSNWTIFGTWNVILTWFG